MGLFEFFFFFFSFGVDGVLRRKLVDQGEWGVGFFMLGVYGVGVKLYGVSLGKTEGLREREGAEIRRMIARRDNLMVLRKGRWAGRLGECEAGYVRRGCTK